MPSSREFVDHTIDLFSAFGEVTARSMFGGWGLYHQGVMFALIAEDVLYLKADAANRGAFEAVGMEPFLYQKGDGSTATMSYWEAPPPALEDPQEMVAWAQGAYEAALRGKKKRR
jgi:DNA transformation protein